MKKIIIGLLALTSLSVFAGELSLTKCQVQLDATTMKLNLTNNIEEGNYVVDANCLDLVKSASEALLGDVKVSGIKLDYTNP